LLDGHRLNTADIGKINWLSIPLGLIESVEVIQGGQSALYGNNAAGGVIKINTRRPTDQLAGQAQVSVGSFDSYNGRFALTGAKGGLGYSVHAEHDETDGYRENSQFEADAAGLKLEWNSGDWFSAFVSFNAVESEYGLPGPLNRAEVAEDYNQ
jgi:iron complex outermembrane receptor protein